MRINKITYHNSTFYGETSTIILADGYAYVMISVMNESPDIAIIHDLIVHTDRRGEGLGHALLEEACYEAGKMGAQVVRLSVAPYSWQEKWYWRNGFARIGEHDTYGNEILQKFIS